MIKAIIAKRAAAIILTLVSSVAVPYILQGRPVLQWAWNKGGPIFVNRVEQRIEQRLAPRVSVKAPGVEIQIPDVDQQ